MKCDVCGSSNSYVKDYEHVYKFKGKEINFTSKRRFCKECNILIYDSILDNEASEKAIALYNEKYGVTKEAIINLRNNYNLSQELFSKVIGCAKKTLISYEKGKSIPNDSYLIIIKSLISKPEAILLLIEANKEQFTSKEYERIKSKLSKTVSNNIKSIDINTEDDLNEYNGYTKYSREKVYNMVLFFAEKTILKTKLLKEMFYADFLYYKETCKSITGLEYAKLPYGPVPNQFETIINSCVLKDFIDYDVEIHNNDYESHSISALKKYDKSLFTNEELEIMNKVRDKFMTFSSSDIVNYSHQEKAFTDSKYSDKISYDYAFDIDLK